MVTLFDAGAVAVARRLACWKGVTFSARRHTFLQRLAVGRLMSAKKPDECCVVFVVVVCAARLLLLRLHSAYLCSSRRPVWGRLMQVCTFTRPCAAVCVGKFHSTRINVSEQHLIEIID